MQFALDQRFRSTLAMLPLALALGTGSAALAFEDERPAAPARGETVSQEFEFFIEAEGEPEPEEFYLIEVATDSEFENVVKTFDSRESRAGWAFGGLKGLEDVPEEYMPANYEGIHLRVKGQLDDGDYYWRVSKAVGGGDWQPLRGEESFRIDTVPPEPVHDLRVDRTPSGTVLLSWGPVGRDLDGNPERVAGFRVYHYTKLLKKYRVMTRYILSERDDFSLELPADTLGEHKIVFFRVQAVDEVGNEEGRRRPKPIGTYADDREHPDADLLTDPNYLRRLAQEER
jgi:hypothetical protein